MPTISIKSTYFFLTPTAVCGSQQQNNLKAAKALTENLVSLVENFELWTSVNFQLPRESRQSSTKRCTGTQLNNEKTKTKQKSVNVKYVGAHSTRY